VDFVRPVQAVIPGAQGRILAVLGETSAELNLRTISRLSGVSLAHASRIMPVLVDLGVVGRREAPPSALFQFIPENVASRAITALTCTRKIVLKELEVAASQIDPAPLSVIVFGSLARGQADSASDIDVLVVRPRSVDEDDDAWHRGLDGWRKHARLVAGNRVEVLEVDEDAAGRSLRRHKPLWTDIERDGVVIFGSGLPALRKRRSA